MLDNVVDRAAEILSQRGVSGEIETAFVFDWALGGLLDGLEPVVRVPYADLPGFPAIETRAGGGAVVVGTHEGRTALYLHGFACERDTGDATAMEPVLETLALCGIRNVVMATGAGSVRADFFPGHLVVVTDHIGVLGPNALRGRADDGGFVNLTEAYDGRLIRRMKRATISAGVSLHEGIYCQFPGPAFETPAEAKIARQFGADIVGQVLVPAVVIARRLGLNVGALGVLTHFCAGFSGGNPSHGEIAKQAQAATISLRRLVRAFLKTSDAAWASTRAGA